jgi:hypothetical protein
MEAETRLLMCSSSMLKAGGMTRITGVSGRHRDFARDADDLTPDGFGADLDPACAVSRSTGTLNA